MYTCTDETCNKIIDTKLVLSGHCYDRALQKTDSDPVVLCDKSGGSHFQYGKSEFLEHVDFLVWKNIWPDRRSPSLSETNFWTYNKNNKLLWFLSLLPFRSNSDLFSPLEGLEAQIVRAQVESRTRPCQGGRWRRFLRCCCSRCYCLRCCCLRCDSTIAPQIKPHWVTY